MPNTRFTKYNIPAPRYTSYPTVPYWDSSAWTSDLWVQAMQHAVKDTTEGISLYIHLPYCESLCTYCGCNTRITKNHEVELPYINSVLKEWRMYRKLLHRNISVNDIHLGGGTPTFFSPENLRFLMEGLLKDVETAPNTEFSFEAHPANTSLEHLETLYDFGFRRLSLGIQDFNPEVQRIINRKQSPADVIRVIQQARQIGYTSINFDLIYGLPLQTLTGIEETIRLAIAMMPDRIAYYSYAHVPWLKPGQRMFTEADLPKDEDKLNFYYTAKEIIKAAGYMDIGMDHFAFPTDNLALASRAGKLHRNFMGYTDKQSSLLLGLGVSAISDGWTAFAQNVKTVEEYKKLINNNILPLLKGHILTDSDLIIRKQILTIMCNGELDLKKEALPPATVKRLAPFIADGMVILTDDKLSVTSIGKSFLRNICMAFDEKIASDKTNKTRFSKAF